MHRQSRCIGGGVRQWAALDRRHLARTISGVKPWKVLDRKLVLQRRWLAISEERVELPNGTIIDEFHVMHAPDWASVIAVTGNGGPDDDIVLVEQYRHGLGRASLELPAGVIDSGEAALAAAQRELREETGFTAAAWQPLIVVAPEPARSTHRAHFFLATGAVDAGPAQPEASEVIAVHRRPLRSLLGEIEQGHMSHAAHIGAILLAARRGLIRI
jgi:8-oxo-dGTP pyrophosphatase MutT (NUDIX family)